MHTLVLIRHGESTWNLENRFTGWTDVDLTDTGIAQANTAGRLLRESGFEFDVAARFETDQLKINLVNFAGGDIPDIPVVEIRL